MSERIEVFEWKDGLKWEDELALRRLPDDEVVELLHITKQTSPRLTAKELKALVWPEDYYLYGK